MIGKAYIIQKDFFIFIFFYVWLFLKKISQIFFFWTIIIIPIDTLYKRNFLELNIINNNSVQMNQDEKPYPLKKEEEKKR